MCYKGELQMKVGSIKMYFVFSLFFLMCGVAMASSEEGVSSFAVNPLSKRMRVDESLSIKPQNVADFFVVLDNKEPFISDRRRVPIDPLKLQKLLYYAFSYFRSSTGYNLWNIEAYPLIRNYHGPFSREVYDDYRGYSIPQPVIEAASKKLVPDLFDDLATTSLEVIYLIFKEKTGKELERQSHKELPYSRVSLYESLRVSDIEEEFKQLHNLIPFLRVFCRRLSVRNAMYLENVFGETFKSLTAGDVESIIEDNDGEEPLPEAVQPILGKMVYPEALLKNIDAKDSLFGRPDVIERVAIAARLGNKRAKSDLSQIFDLFSVETDDIYAKTAEIIQSSLEGAGAGAASAVPSEEKVPGYLEYSQAQERSSSVEAEELYRESLGKGYGRAGFEIAKMKITEGDPEMANDYLKKAFDAGMLTATDLMMTTASDDEKIEYLKKRGKLGDPMGYYNLAKILEEKNIIAEETEGAIAYYKKALPFFGHTELLGLRDTFRVVGCDLSETVLDSFFKDIVDLYNQEEVKKIWEGVPV
jgi:uncharacterized phage-associated protein